MKLWQACVKELEHTLPEDDINTWIRPLTAEAEGNHLKLSAPNKMMQTKIYEHYLVYIREALAAVVRDGHYAPLDIRLESLETAENQLVTDGVQYEPFLNTEQVFENFIEGKSNQLAKATAQQVATQPGISYNPFLIYSGVGLGKTHLMHAIGNAIRKHSPNMRVRYLHSEQFVSDMVRALRSGMMDRFTRFYRELDVLLIDDVQFFAGKEQSQEEFFHTFNHLFGSRSQIVMTCDRYPKEIDRLEDRLKSRFSSGLTQSIEPPELETRAAIVLSKAKQRGLVLSEEVSFFIAETVRANVRELEGALRRVEAHAKFSNRAITVPFTKEILKDLIAASNRQLSVDDIQKTVAEYYSIRFKDLLSPSRSRSVTRPRQIAMALSKELTNYSLPEIGKAFGGRDHTTVIHACRLVKNLRAEDVRIEQDYKALWRALNH